MATAPRLSLCMIVRDSARTLPACLESIARWVDELVVVDTGSLDDTRSIASKYSARVFDFPWCDDFSAARNESLCHATGEWLFWMDSDDTISAENGRQLRALAKRSLKTATTAYATHRVAMLNWRKSLLCVPRFTRIISLFEISRNRSQA